MKITLKQTAAASALFCLLCGGAAAGNVSISGAYDTSLQVMHAKGEGTTFSMAPDQIYSTGLHINADEDLGNGFGVEAKLWLVASADTGEIASPDGALFNHTLLAVKTPYGRFGAGRFGAFGSGFGPLGQWWKADPFYNGAYDAGPQGTTPGIYGELLRNSVFYESPDMNGFKTGVLFSLTSQSNTEGAKNCDDTKFWELFGSYKNGGLLLMADVQGFHYGHADSLSHMDDLFRAKLAGTYEFGNGWQVYGGYAYGKNEVKFTTSAWGNRPDFSYDASRPNKDGMNGRGLDMHSVYAGVKKSIDNWDFMAMAQGQWGKNKGQSSTVKADPDFAHYIGSVGAYYNLSKRTMIYSAASFSFVDKGWKHNEAQSLERRVFMLGMAHAF